MANLSEFSYFVLARSEIALVSTVVSDVRRQVQARFESSILLDTMRIEEQRVRKEFTASFKKSHGHGRELELDEKDEQVLKERLEYAVEVERRKKKAFIILEILKEL